MRIIVWEKEICADKEADGEIILYSLASSHAVRIDTVLYIGSGRNYVKLEGAALRHLHPQKKSLEGFVEKIICSWRKAPGVARVSRIDIGNIDVGIAPGNTDTPIYTALNILGRRRGGNILITNRYALIHHASPRITISSWSAPYFITAAHYIIDQATGASVRRRGRVEYRERRRP